MGLTVVVVLVGLAVVALIALLAVRGRQRRQEQQRIEAAERRHEAEINTASAERREAEATERSARADQEQAQAREQAARARKDRELADARYAAADRTDPDSGSRSRGDGAAGDSADRTDDMPIGGSGTDGRPQGEAQQGAPQAGAPGREQEQERSDTSASPRRGSGWHGPTASGGFARVEPGARDATPNEGGAPSDQGATGRHRDESGGDVSGAVPEQRSGDHDRKPMRSLADRLLRRNG